MRWSDSTHGERLKNAKIGLDPAKKSADAIRGYLWGHFCRLAAQPIDLYDNVIVAASTNQKGLDSLQALFLCVNPRATRSRATALPAISASNPAFTGTWRDLWMVGHGHPYEVEPLCIRPVNYPVLRDVDAAGHHAVVARRLPVESPRQRPQQRVIELISRGPA